MTGTKQSMEERILTAVKLTLANVIRDTSTPHGLRHPLSDGTIEDLRQCLALISARERELAAQAGQAQSARPRFTDESPPEKQVMRFHKKGPAEDPGRKG